MFIDMNAVPEGHDLDLSYDHDSSTWEAVLTRPRINSWEVEKSYRSTGLHFNPEDAVAEAARMV